MSKHNYNTSYKGSSSPPIHSPNYFSISTGDNKGREILTNSSWNPGKTLPSKKFKK